MLFDRLPIVFIVFFLASCAGPGAQVDIAKQQKLLAEQDYESLKAQKTLLVRYNPAPCDCTGYEVNTPKGWRRAVLVFEDLLAKQPVKQALHAAFVRGIPGPIRLKAEVDAIKKGKCGNWSIVIDVQGVNDATH